MAKWETLLDPIFVGGMDGRCAGQTAATFRVFGLEQMPFARARAQNFASGGDFEPLGHGFLGLDAFGTSHKI